MGFGRGEGEEKFMHSNSGGAGQSFTRHFHTGCARVWFSLNVWKGRADVDSEYILNI